MFFPTIKENLKSIKNYTPGKPIEEVEREFGLKNAIKMASNENALGASPKALAAIKKNLNKIYRYPDGGCFYLREKIAGHLKLKPDQIVFGNGSDEILVMAVRAFVGPSDEVIIADPTFLIYEIATSVEEGRVIKVPMKDFHYDLDAMRSRLSARTKLIFIANPDNPVGTYVNERKLIHFLRLIPKDVVVVLDEAYYEFACVKKDYPNSLALLAQYPNLIISRTFSKAYGLAGLRVGYGVASANMINSLNKVREPFNVNLLAQVAAIAALEDKNHLKKSVQVVEVGRKYLENEFKKMGITFVPTATNFILADLKVDASPIYDKLLRKGIIIRPMSAWGLKTFIRVTIGKAEENKKFITLLKNIL